MTGALCEIYEYEPSPTAAHVAWPACGDGSAHRCLNHETLFTCLAEWVKDVNGEHGAVAPFGITSTKHAVMDIKNAELDVSQ